MWKKYGIPIKSQRLIIDRLLAKDDQTLYTCGVKRSYQVVYLYLVSKKEEVHQEPLYESIEEYQPLGSPLHQPQLAPLGSPVQQQFDIRRMQQQQQQGFVQNSVYWMNESHVPANTALNYVQTNLPPINNPIGTGENFY